MLSGKNDISTVLDIMLNRIFLIERIKSPGFSIEIFEYLSKTNNTRIQNSVLLKHRGKKLKIKNSLEFSWLLHRKCVIERKSQIAMNNKGL